MVMRWFTRAWHEGEAEVDLASYREHLAALEQSLPEEVACMAQVDLHDGLFVETSLERPMRFRIFCGNLQIGYREVTLDYEDAHVAGTGRAQVEEWLSDPATEILYDKIDVVDEEIEHRLLLWPAGEFAVRFRGLALAEEAADASYREERFERRPR